MTQQDATANERGCVTPTRCVMVGTREKPCIEIPDKDGNIVSVEIDHQTCRIPIVKIMHVVGNYANSKTAREAWTRLSKADDELTQLVGEPMRINGAGQAVFAATREVMTQILWMLPGKATRAYRAKCARIITRFHIGDQTLHDELENNRGNAEAVAWRHSTTRLQTPPRLPENITAPADNPTGLYNKRKAELLELEIEQAKKKLTMEYANSAFELLNKMEMLSEPNKMAISHSVMSAMQSDLRMLCADESPEVSERP